MGTHLKGNKLRPDNLERSQDHLRSFPTEAISRWEIVTAVGSSGLHRTVAKASSANSRDASRQLFLAVSPGEVRTPAAPNCIIVEQGAIRGKAGGAVDTSAAALLDPVYLSTSGGWSLTPGTQKRIIGHVLKVDAVLGIVAFDGRMAEASLSTTATVIIGSNTIAVGFDASLAGSPIVASVRGTVADETVADATLTTVVRAYWSGTSVVVEGNANATAATLVSVVLVP